MSKNDKIIQALKLVIASYEHSIKTGEAIVVYIQRETGIRRCPLCVVIREDCIFCPAAGCRSDPNYISPANSSPDPEKAARRIKYLQNKLEKYEHT